MFKQLIATGAAALITITAAHAAPLNQWLGNWEKNAGGLDSLSISNAGGNLTVSVNGECTPNPCDWGSVPATAYSNSAATDPTANTEAIIAVFNQGFSTKTVVLDGRAGDTLRAHVYTHFVDNSGRNDYVLHASMKKAPLTLTPVPGVIVAQPLKPFSEDCISFNPDQVSVARRNGSWKLIQGNMWMLDAGSNRNEMTRARDIVKRYGLNKQCFVGRPDASLHYWLVDNGAPSGAIPGEDCVNINPNNLSVRNNGGNFTVVSNGNHFAFSAPTQAEAQEIIKVIEYYGFTKSCFVGRPGPSMSYLRK
ncbi:hypothetical protein PUV54_05145 [Hyphococcus flavus]|uniref:Phosphodiester glycosidase domain-containing protein n=1 Tax=Hyphococcus flavus TaxID=1866326 RepID=A0AAF0CGM6_9PROT|nr:hypothetical protein [Hyphococcus flavus]WDI32579.1 hypothetical protein PUV54_05145 [Hyphococcus flavus]